MRQWLEASTANQVYYDELKKVWDTSLQLAAASTVDENEAWKRFRQRIQHNASNENLARPSRQASRFPWIRIAASIAVIVGLTLLGYRIFSGNAPRQVMAASGNTVLNDTLPDGSIAILNKSSSLSYPSRFKDDKRAVTLKGEAFFHVKPDKTKPFIISVNDLEVTVVGTSFNIRSENGHTSVIVETGVVRVTRNGKTIELRADEQLSATPSGGFAKEAVTDKLYNYYRSKEFVCDDTPLWKLVEVLNEAYQANIVIARPALRNLRINTTFYNESLDRVLDLISLTLNVKITRNAGEVIIE